MSRRTASSNRLMALNSPWSILNCHSAGKRILRLLENANNHDLVERPCNWLLEEPGSVLSALSLYATNSRSILSLSSHSWVGILNAKCHHPFIFEDSIFALISHISFAFSLLIRLLGPHAN
jgi:hypothetical protein